MSRRLVVALASSALGAGAIFACSSDALDSLALDAGYRFLDGAVQHDGAVPIDGSYYLPDGALVTPTGDDAGNTDTPDTGSTPPDPTNPTGCQTCDCDHDGYNRPNCGDGQGKDCNDSDPNVHPGAAFSSTATSDIDCDGKITKEYDGGVSCTGLVCPASEGFTTEVACGQQGDYVTCKAVLIVGCQVDTTVKKTQACK